MNRPPPLDAGDAVFLDFDGTLAGLQDDPETVFLAPGLDEVLVALSARLGGALAVISGRDAGDLARRVPLALWRVGNHGLIRLAPGDAAPGSRASAPEEVDAVLRDLAASFDGTRVEVKGPVLALHYRNAPQAGPAIGEALAAAGLDAFGYSLQAGKFVFEAKPGDANKGQALARLMQQAPFCERRAVMIGDDTTDEDAFVAANAIRGLTIKVGAGQTVARYRLDGVEDVHAYLGELTGA